MCGACAQVCVALGTLHVGAKRACYDCIYRKLLFLFGAWLPVSAQSQLENACFLPDTVCVCSRVFVCDDFILLRTDSDRGVDDSNTDNDEGDNAVFVPVGGGPHRGW